jgi:hypothetical protein
MAESESSRQPSTSGAAPPPQVLPVPPVPPVLPVLPVPSQDEADVGWGERPQADDDERLRRERPPHWDFS